MSNLREELKTCKDVVIIGGGFIGSEAASSIKLRYKGETNVNLISSEKSILYKVLGKEISEALYDDHIENGVVIHSEKRVKEIKEEDGKATFVVLNDGTEIKADLVIIGTGIQLST